MLVRKENRVFVKKVKDEGNGFSNTEEWAVQNIVLTARNTYRIIMQIQSLVDSLVKKSKKGVDIEEEKLANSSIMEAIIRESIKEWDRLDAEDVRKFINTNIRNLAKKELAEYIIREVEWKVDRYR